VLFVLCAPSCGDEQETSNREETILTDSKNDIRREFETEYLTESSLFAYEANATQKLSDFVDYLRTLTDTTLDMAFREKAGEMIHKTFQSDHVTIQLTEKNEQSAGEFEVHELIKYGLEDKLPIPTFAFDSIFIHEPLHRIGNVTYSGILKFSQDFSDNSKTGKILKSIHRNADFYVVKENKIFGSDTLKIWSVRLGEIR
jgi:hypothetical protein